MGQCCSGEKHKEKEDVALPEEDLNELVTTTGLDVSELNKYHKDFLKAVKILHDDVVMVYDIFFGQGSEAVIVKGAILVDYPSGHLTKSQFKAIYQEFFPDDPKRKNFADKLFQTYDQNNDGTIDFREFMIALSLISKGTVRQKLALAFSLYDSNGDGVLSYAEILEVVKAMYHMAGDPVVCEDVPPAETFAKKLFTELDRNSDGNITIEEFTEVGSQDVTVANLLLAKITEDGDDEENICTPTGNGT